MKKVEAEMPEIQPADRDAARALQSDHINRLALRSVPEESLMDMLARHLAAHRVAERERWEAACSATLREAQGRINELKEYGTDKAYEEGVYFGARRVWDLSTPPAPADSPLTEEAVKAMLPVRDGAYRTNTATYLGKFGSIEWIDLHSGFLLYVSGRLTQLSELTAAKLAALIAALGIDAGVKQ